ncbi:hypothetical protein Tco_0554605, partial [Tanacetum coccineum]
VATAGALPPLPLPPTFTIRSSMLIFSASLANKPGQYDSKMTLAVIEEVDNHMPEVVIIDEISTRAELKACQSMVEI